MPPDDTTTPTPLSESPLLRLTHGFSVGMIWAQSLAGVIGKNGDLPWHLPEDLTHFKATTMGYPVLHGRKSYAALPASFRPLPGRRNLVLTRASYVEPGVEVVNSLAEALSIIGNQPWWVVGGSQVYALAMDIADLLVVTEVDIDVDGDTFAPHIDPAVWTVAQEGPWVTSSRGPRMRVLEYRRLR